jgi:DNA-directed RNA polymerase subunit N (RpoN/RPB10)
MSKQKYLVAGVLFASIAMGGTAYAADTANRSNGFDSRIRGSRGAIEAQLLGITQEEFQTRIENGESPKEMLDAAGITRNDLQAAMREGAKERLSQAVANGKLTQAEADARLADMAARDAKHEAIETALKNNDYAAWAAASVGTPMADKITEANFAKFVQAHTLMEQGNRDGARAIMDELGIEPPKGMNRGHGDRGRMR